MIRAQRKLHPQDRDTLPAIPSAELLAEAAPTCPDCHGGTGLEAFGGGVDVCETCNGKGDKNAH